MAQSQQHKAFEAIRAPLVQFLANTLQRLVGDEPEWWQNRVLSRFTRGPAPASLSTIQVQELMHVYLSNLENDGPKSVRLFGRYSAPSSIRSYLEYAKGVRNKWAHENSTPVTEQYADLVVCGRLVDVLSDVRHPLPACDAQLAEVIRRPAASFLRSIASDSDEQACSQPTDGNLQLQSELTLLKEALAEIKGDIRRLQVSPPVSSGEPSESPTPPTPDVFSALEERVSLQTGALYQLVARIESAESALRDLSAGTTTLLGRMGSLASMAGRLEAMHTVVQSTSQAVVELQEAVTSLEPEAEDGDAEVFLPSLTVDEVRSQLVALRAQIWEQCGTGPSRTGLLRKNMLELIIEKRIASDRDLRQHVPQAMRSELDRRELRFLPDIYELVARMD